MSLTINGESTNRLTLKQKDMVVAIPKNMMEEDEFITHSVELDQTD